MMAAADQERSQVDQAYLAKFSPDVSKRLFASVVADVRTALFDFESGRINEATLIAVVHDRLDALRHLAADGTVRAALEHAELTLCQAVLAIDSPSLN